MLEPDKAEKAKFLKESQEYTRIILKEMFSGFFSKLDALLVTKNDERCQTFLNGLCTIDAKEDQIADYKLTADGKFVRNSSPTSIADQLVSLRGQFQIVQKVIEFLIVETDLIMTCCWNEGRRPIVNRVDIAAMFYLVAVEGLDLDNMKVGPDDAKIQFQLTQLQVGKEKFKLHR